MIPRRSKSKRGKKRKNKIRLSRRFRKSKTSFKIWMIWTSKSWSRKVHKAVILSKTSGILPKVRHFLFSHRQDSYRLDLLPQSSQHETWPVKTLPIDFSSKAALFFPSHWAYIPWKYRSEIEAKRIIHARVPYQKTCGREACCPTRPELSPVNKMIRIFTSEKW